jgi:ubiquinone/menaquinone biosynthesis C-methylase UbiE
MGGSVFEAGCGFGWNIRRAKELYPAMRVGGLDFSETQLLNGRKYMQGYDIETVQGDCCAMPLPDCAYDLGFTLGVFMNIHQDHIHDAAREMMRVCARYILHVEYNEDCATAELRERRVVKTNIISHDYKTIYESLGARTLEMLTHDDFGEAFQRHVAQSSPVKDRWEKIEGPDKYVLYLFERE